jgi:hypothetical protein
MEMVSSKLAGGMSGEPHTDSGPLVIHRSYFTLITLKVY